MKAKIRASHLGALRAAAVSITTVLLGLGCGGDDHRGNGNSNSNSNSCPDGFRADGPACVPIFDDPDECPGPNEMPALGGGCQPVGVLLCADGFVADGDGGCEPILPDHDCLPGTMEMIGRTSCQPVGVVECANGFISDGAGGCDAILPPSPGPGLELCPHGYIALLGHTTCQPLGNCGAGPEQGGSPWGTIQTDASTVFVDATADASGADGTQASPFPTINAALAVVTSGGQVAIAAGEYEESLELSKPVRLAGRCAERVTLVGQGSAGEAPPTVLVTSAATGSTVGGVTLTGPGHGLELKNARQIAVQEVEVRGTGGWGVDVWDQAEVTLRQVKVVGCSTFGLLVQDSTIHGDQLMVQGTLSDPATSSWGRGIHAQCTNPTACGSLTMTSSLVLGNREQGLFATGVDVTVRSSVVRDTLPRESNQTDGWGIAMFCNPDSGVCGSLLVEASLVANNHTHGILAFGVDTTVRNSVVRDTQAKASDGTDGDGICTLCDTDLATCGTLLVDSSLVTGNRDVGLYAGAADATVMASVISNTLPRESDQMGGTGISAFCAPDVGICGNVSVDSSLVTGNRRLGIGSWGVDLAVRASVVRDTLPSESDRELGRGINAGCEPAMDECGTLLLEGSVVAGNREAGVAAIGAMATVRASVVRDTLPREIDGLYGVGINAACDIDLGICGVLLVEGSVVARNREAGVAAIGAMATVTASVVRDTLPEESGQKYGLGIGAQCDSSKAWCSSLLVESSLVAGNHGAGVFTAGVDATVRASVVRDTQPNQSDLTRGRGIGAQYHPAADSAGSLLVEGCLLVGNHDVGIFTAGVDATVLSSVVHDTLPQESDLAFGRGINARCCPDSGHCGFLSVQSSLIMRNEDVGIYVEGASCDLQGVSVIDTVTNTAGSTAGEHGLGVWGQCDLATSTCGAFSITSCLVSSSYGVGIGLEGVSGYMTGTVVESVYAQPNGGLYGFGIQIGGREGADRPAFHVQGCLIRDAKLTGLLYYLSTGLLSDSVVSGGEYSVAMNEGSSPTIAEGNDLSGTLQSDPAWVSLLQCPAPPPAMPSDPFGW